MRTPEKTEATVAYYNRHASQYFEATVGVDMSPLYVRFLHYIPKSGTILDAGSGSGRDTAAFLNLGYHVEAFDPSIKLAELSTRLTGIKTIVKSFDGLSDIERYDGIWACASLLHVAQIDLPAAFERCRLALKRRGALYMSFREGSGEYGLADGRQFTDLTAPVLGDILKTVLGLSLEECWANEGRNSAGKPVTWLNAIAVREK